MVCPGCLKPIDEAFDSVHRDDRGRPWHAGCSSKAQRRPSHWKAIGEVAIWLVCWPLGLARWIGRARQWSNTRANLIGLVGAAVVIVAFTAAQGGFSSSTTTIDRASLEAAVRGDVEKWLTTNSQVGTSATLDASVCEPVDASTYKCKTSGSLTDGTTKETGHMTVAATVDGDRYSWQMTEGWTPDE